MNESSQCVSYYAAENSADFLRLQTPTLSGIHLQWSEMAVTKQLIAGLNAMTFSWT